MADVASALQDAEVKMNKAVEVAKDDFASIRTGRAHPSLFNKVWLITTAPTPRCHSSHRFKFLKLAWH